MTCKCPSIKSETEWYIKAGARFRVMITLRDAKTGKLFDLTDYTVGSHFRLNQYDYSLPVMWEAVCEIQTPATKGKVMLTLVPQTTKFMGGHGRGFFDVELYHNDDVTDRRRPLEGRWSVSLESTIESF